MPATETDEPVSSAPRPRRAQEEFDRLETRFLVRRGWLNRRGPLERHRHDEPHRIRTTATSMLRGRDRASCIADWPAPGVLGHVHSRYE